MPKISADYNRILSAAGEFSSQSERIRQLRTEIQNIMKQIPLETTYFTAAKTRMLIQCMSVNNIGNKYKRIGSSLEEIEAAYRDADNRALNGSDPIGITGGLWEGITKGLDVLRNRWTDTASDLFRRFVDATLNEAFRTCPGILPYTPGAADAIRNFLLPAYGIGSAAVVMPALAMTAFLLTPKTAQATVSGLTVTDERFKLLSKFKGKPDGPFMDTNDKIKDSLKNNGLSSTKSYNSDTKKQGLDSDAAKRMFTEEQLKNMKDANKFMKREVDMELVGASKEVSVASASASGSNGFSSYEAEVKALKAEAHAGAGLGEYAYKDATGKVHHGAGIYAEVGGSASVLETEVKGRLGNENLGLYGKAEGKVLSAGATAGGNIGVVDGKVQAYAGGKVEAVLVEGSVSGGVSVGGVDVGATATGKVGFSANANVGLKDGHIVVDAGLAVGVGGEIKLDIDVSKPLEKIKEVGPKVLCTAASGAKEFFGNMFR